MRSLVSTTLLKRKGTDDGLTVTKVPVCKRDGLRGLRNTGPQQHQMRAEECTTLELSSIEKDKGMPLCTNFVKSNLNQKTKDVFQYLNLLQSLLETVWCPQSIGDVLDIKDKFWDDLPVFLCEAKLGKSTTISLTLRIPNSRFVLCSVFVKK